MFESHFGLRENPFAAAHQARYIYPSPEHQEAIAHLRYGIENREPFVLITGEVGTGKTTALYDALSEWQGRAVVGLITNSSLTRPELLEEIALRLGLALAPGSSKPQIMVQLEKHLLSVHAQGHRVILLLDEAQNLEPELLEEIRLLSNLESTGHKLVQVFLVGQPELEAKLNRPLMRQLRQRIAVHYRLSPLGPADTERYIQHRITVAGGHALSIFPPEACAAVHALSHGIPREINHLCMQALVNAFVEESSSVTPEHVRAGARDLKFRSVLETDPVVSRSVPPAPHKNPTSSPPAQVSTSNPAEGSKTVVTPKPTSPSNPAGAPKPIPTTKPEAASKSAAPPNPAATPKPVPATKPEATSKPAPPPAAATSASAEPGEPASAPRAPVAKETPVTNKRNEPNESSEPTAGRKENAPQREVEPPAPKSDAAPKSSETPREAAPAPEKPKPAGPSATPPSKTSSTQDDWDAWFASLAPKAAQTLARAAQAGNAEQAPAAQQAPKTPPAAPAERTQPPRAAEPRPNVGNPIESKPPAPAKPSGPSRPNPLEGILEPDWRAPSPPEGRRSEFVGVGETVKEKPPEVPWVGESERKVPEPKPTYDTIPARLREKLEAEAVAPVRTSKSPVGALVLVGVIAVVAIGGFFLFQRFSGRGGAAPEGSSHTESVPASQEPAPAPTVDSSAGMPPTVQGSGPNGTPAPGGATAPKSEAPQPPAAAAPPPSTTRTTASNTTPSPATSGGSATVPAAAAGAAATAAASTPAPSAPAPTAPKTEAAPAQEQTYAIAVGTYMTETRAEAERTRLSTKAGQDARLDTVEEDGTQMYRVLMGRFTGRAAAERAASDLIEKGVVDVARIVAVK
jgi:type II secretory pathway predicted ATPase ExeA/cell division protein FtsN